MVETRDQALNSQGTSEGSQQGSLKFRCWVSDTVDGSEIWWKTTGWMVLKAWKIMVDNTDKLPTSTAFRWSRISGSHQRKVFKPHLFGPHLLRKHNLHLSVNNRVGYCMLLMINCWSRTCDPGVTCGECKLLCSYLYMIIEDFRYTPNSSAPLQQEASYWQDLLLLKWGWRKSTNFCLHVCWAVHLISFISKTSFEQNP